MSVAIHVCRNCLEHKKILNAARDLKKKFGNEIQIELVDCLDQCHYPPAVKVNDQLIIWADGGKLREAVLSAIKAMI